TPTVQEMILELERPSGWSGRHASHVTGAQIFECARAEAKADGVNLVTLAEAAAMKVQRGLTSLSEINRVLGVSPLAFLGSKEGFQDDQHSRNGDLGKGASSHAKVTAVRN
ncbi:MAG TPA: hypothetical protein VEZ90_02570, partial [Blastocatellia bacterium]|nr:hypothetical protein [Blastocatellia bacterium]